MIISHEPDPQSGAFPSESFFIGDMWEDILTGKNFGLKTILVKTGREKDYNSTIEPDFIVEDVNEAADKVIS